MMATTVRYAESKRYSLLLALLVDQRLASNPLDIGCITGLSAGLGSNMHNTTSLLGFE